MLDDEGREALELAYREFGGELWRAIYAYAGGLRDIADESVAEAFTQAGSRLSQIRSLRPWVYRAAFRIAAGELKRRAAQLVLDQQDRVGMVDQERDRQELTEMLKRLSPNQRAAFLLREVLGYSSPESARMLGVSEVAIRVHVHAARRRLREQLREEEQI